MPLVCNYNNIDDLGVERILTLGLENFTFKALDASTVWSVVGFSC